MQTLIASQAADSGGTTAVSMFYLLIQIHNIRQLQKIKQPYMTSVERSILNLLESRGARHVRADGGDALFLFTGGQTTETKNLVDAVFSAYRYLVSRRDDLMGFLLLLEATAEEDHEAVLRGMRTKLRTAELDEALLVGESAAPGLESQLRMHWSNGYWVVDERNVRAPTKLGEAAEFCRHPQIHQQVVDALGTYWDDDWKPGVLLLHGPRMSGKRQNLSYALERLGGEEGRSSYIELNPGVRRQSVISPLVNSLRGWELGEVPIHLSARERPSWAERIGLLESLLGQRGDHLCPDSLQRDFLLAYGLFVQAFVRRMEALLIPAVLVCYNVQAYQTDTLEILGSVFERFLPSQAFIPILVSQKPYLPPELRDFPYRKLRIPAIDDAVTDELSRRFLDESPGGPKPPEWIRERTGGNIVSMFYLFHVQTRAGLKETEAADVPPELRTVWGVICGSG